MPPRSPDVPAKHLANLAEPFHPRRQINLGAAGPDFVRAVPTQPLFAQRYAANRLFFPCRFWRKNLLPAKRAAPVARVRAAHAMTHPDYWQGVAPHQPGYKKRRSVRAIAPFVLPYHAAAVVRY